MHCSTYVSVIMNVDICHPTLSAWHNIAIRRHLAGELQITGSVFQCLRLSLKEQQGPHMLIDILRLIQVLTYERTVVLGVWTNDLISFLLGEMYIFIISSDDSSSFSEVDQLPNPNGCHIVWLYYAI